MSFSGVSKASWHGHDPVPRGFALALALLATILIAALLAAFFFAVNQETQTGAAIAKRDRALALAESALDAGFRLLQAPRADTLPVGTLESRAITVEGKPASVHLTHLDGGLFWLVAVIGADGDPAGSERRIGGFAARSGGTSDSTSVVRVTRRGWSELF